MYCAKRWLKLTHITKTVPCYETIESNANPDNYLVVTEELKQTYPDLEFALVKLDKTEDFKQPNLQTQIVKDSFGYPNIMIHPEEDAKEISMPEPNTIYFSED